MQLIFDSLTGNVRRLAGRVTQRLDAPPALDVRHAEPDGDFLLLTYTFHRGAVPDTTLAFLARHGHRLRGVVASGSYHWGTHFARAADVIAAQYGIPVVAKVNKGGTDADVAQITGWIQAHHHTHLYAEAPWNPGSN